MHLSPIQRLTILKLYNELESDKRINKAKIVSIKAWNEYHIEISQRGVRKIVRKFAITQKCGDLFRSKKHSRVISNVGLLAINKFLLQNPFATSSLIKAKLGLLASKRTITEYCNRLGWFKIQSKYCQIVTPVNRLKRFIYACYCKK